MSDQRQAPMKILVIAPNIPQVYIALALMPRLAALFTDCTFVVFTMEKHFHHFACLPGNRTTATWQQEHGLSMALYIGHSYFLSDACLDRLHGIGCPAYWINAHFEPEDLRRWRNQGAQLRHSFDAVFYDDLDDTQALLALGFQRHQLHHVGNAKYDGAAANPSQIAAARQLLGTMGAHAVIVAASVASPAHYRDAQTCETELIAATFKTLLQSFPKVKLVLAPRSLDQIDATGAVLRRHGLAFDVSSQYHADASSASLSTAAAPVLMLDEIGLLKGFFYCSTVALMGRTFFPVSGGGSNIIEPAAAALPIVCGPFMQGQQQTLQDFIQAGAIRQVDQPMMLLPVMLELLGDAAAAKAHGLRAREVVRRHVGALDRSAALLSRLIASHVQGVSPS